MELIDATLLAHASPAELAAYENALRLELALQSPLDYAEYVSPRTERTRHQEFINDILLRLLRGELRHPVTGAVVWKLAVSLPPRHGKSYLISDHLPAWFLTLYPEREVAVCSYEGDFAKTWGRKARAHIEEHPEFGVYTDKETRAANNWNTTNGGGMHTAGTGGPITGKGVDLLVIDDPIKNAQDAMSPTIRETAYDWMLSTALTRRNRIPETPVILMATRWHEDDLTGRMIAEDPEGWYVLNIAALALEDDPLGRLPGEALWPDRVGVQALVEIRDTGEGGKKWFAAMYQGQPALEEGNFFLKEDFRYWADASKGTYYAVQNEAGGLDYIPKSECIRFITVDLAASKKTSADWTVAATWDLTRDKKLLLVGLRRVRIETTDHIRFTETAFKEDKAKSVHVEPVTFGLSLIQAIRLQTSNMPIQEVPVDTDKITRAIPARAYMERHLVYFPRHAPWLDVWENELLRFFNGTHDDQVDTLSMAVYVVTQGVYSARRRNPRLEPATMQERADKLLETLVKKKQRERILARNHPELGKMRY